MDESAAVHDAVEAGEHEHRHQHEHDQQQGAQAQQSLVELVELQLQRGTFR